MATWLLPFGFGAGLLFTFITNLDTFAFAGPIGQPLIGGLLGLGSGWMGSYAAAASVSLGQLLKAAACFFCFCDMPF